MKDQPWLLFTLYIAGLDLLCFVISKVIIFPFLIVVILNLRVLDLFSFIFNKTMLYHAADLSVTIYPLGCLILLVVFVVLGVIVDLSMRLFRK